MFAFAASVALGAIVASSGITQASPCVSPRGQTSLSPCQGEGQIEDNPHIASKFSEMLYERREILSTIPEVNAEQNGGDKDVHNLFGAGHKRSLSLAVKEKVSNIFMRSRLDTELPQVSEDYLQQPLNRPMKILRNREEGKGLRHTRSVGSDSKKNSSLENKQPDILSMSSGKQPTKEHGEKAGRRE